MTEDELRAFVAEARAEVDARLAELDQVDTDALPAPLRAQYDADRQALLDLRDSLADEAIAAEVEATTHARRDLTPAEVRALRGNH